MRSPDAADLSMGNDHVALDSVGEVRHDVGPGTAATSLIRHAT